LPRPTLLVDYTHGGCAAIVVSNCSRSVVQHIVIDAYRLPFTVAVVLSGSTPTSIALQPEEALPSIDRPQIYQWDQLKYNWLNTIRTSQKVVAGARATRQLADVGIANVNMTSATNPSTGVITMTFDAPNPARSQLVAGDRIFLKHYENMESWGVYGWNVSGMTLDQVSLWSVSGMGLRCDLCSSTYLLTHSDVSIRPGSLRPM
jgi:hypothetical protein